MKPIRLPIFRHKALFPKKKFLIFYTFLLNKKTKNEWWSSIKCVTFYILPLTDIMFGEFNEAVKPQTSLAKYSVEFNDFAEPQRLHRRSHLRLLVRPYGQTISSSPIHLQPERFTRRMLYHMCLLNYDFVYSSFHRSITTVSFHWIYYPLKK